MLTPVHIIGILLTVGILIVVSIMAGRRVNDVKTFTTGGTSGRWMVGGAIMGTLVSGQSTIGTAQLAFAFGVSAWWYSIGAALGCLLLGLAYARSLRSSGCTTLTEIIRNAYGPVAERVGSVLCLIGIFISIVSQVLSTSAMMTSLFQMAFWVAALLSGLLIMCFVLFGGIKSAGVGGIIKLVLLYISSITAGCVVWYLGKGPVHIIQDISTLLTSSSAAPISDFQTVADVNQHYGNFLARGPVKDIGSCISLALGVISTQTYAQCIWSGRNDRESRQGALLSSLLMPLIGVACTLVGMYMRAHYVTVAELESLTAMGASLPEGIGVIQNSAQAFPCFILYQLPPWIGGVMLGTLFVTVLGGASGLSLGAATIVVRDILPNRWKGKTKLVYYRTTIAILLMVAVVVSLSVRSAFINDLGFLALGLRATALLIPLSLALFRPGRIQPRWAVASMVAGVAVMLIAKFAALPAEPIFWGLAAASICLLSPKSQSTK